MAESTSTKKYYFGTGRRKTAVATIRLVESPKTIIINGKDAELSEEVLAPLTLVGKKNAFGISVHVNGGGKKSQMDAIRHGIARALEQVDSGFRTTLKKAEFLTRDPREKERKKPGLKRARRAPQWAKR